MSGEEMQEDNEPTSRVARYRVRQERYKLYQEFIKFLVVLVSASLTIAGALSLTGLP